MQRTVFSLLTIVLLALGGLGVYVANDLRLERRVAIKIMHDHLADDIQFKERFIQEARSAARQLNYRVEIWFQLSHGKLIQQSCEGENQFLPIRVLRLTDANRLNEGTQIEVRKTIQF